MAGTSLTRLGLETRTALKASTNGNGRPESKSFPTIDGVGTFYPWGPWWGDVGAFDTELKASPETAYVVSALCFAAIRYRASNLAEAPLQLVRVPAGDDADAVPVTSHPLIEVLEEPSPDCDQAELIEITQTWLDLFGQALWVKDMNRRGETARLVGFAGDEFTVSTAGDRIYGRFDLEAMRGPRTRTADEVVYFRTINPYHRISAASLTQVACSWLNLSLETQRAVQKILKHAMMPGGVISPHQDWNPDKTLYDDFKANINAYHAGPANQGKPLILLGGSKFSPTSMPVKDMLPKELLHRCEAVIASVFGVAPVVLGWEVGLENSPWSNMAEARRMTYEDTLEPLWKWFARKLSRQLLTRDERRSGLEIRFDLSMVRALQDDDVERSQVADTNSGIWSINERRAYTGKPPAEGEEYDEVPKRQPPPAMGAQPGDPNEPGSSDPSSSASDEGADPKAAAQLAERKAVAELAWMRFDVQTKAAESAWRWQIEDELATDLSETIGLVRTHLKSAKAIDPTLFDGFVQALSAFVTTSWTKRWLSRTEPLYKSTATAALEALSTEIGIGFDVLEPTILPWVQKHAAEMVTHVTRTTRESIRGLVEQGIKDGLSVDDIAKELRKAHAFSKERARLIARTETTKATNGSKRTALSEYQATNADATVLKTWLATKDERVREEHARMDGTEIGIDDVFDNGLTEPGEPNCRCTLTYRIERE